MSGKAAKIQLTEKQHNMLQLIHRSTTAPNRFVQRVSVILMAFDGMLNMGIANQIGLARKQVGLWRRRWQQSFDALVAIECRESQAELRRAIEDVLSDAPRSGSTGSFTAEQVTQILAVACEPPEQSGRPIDRWTHRELAVEVVGRGIVKSISVSQVGRYLSQAELQPHRSKYWLNTKEKDPEVFQQQVEFVCHTYLEAPDLYFQENTHTVSVDEMPGLQALERIAKTIPMRPGQPERIEYEYKRHGTLCLMGNWDVVLGQMIAPTIRETRTEEDFAWHIHHTIQTDAQAGWVLAGRQFEYPLQRNAGPLCCSPGRDGREHVGAQGQVRHPEIDGDAASLSFRPPSSHPVRLLAEAHFVVESDRNRVWDRWATCRTARQLLLAIGLEGTLVGIHRLLQPHLCEAVPMDLHWPSRHCGDGQTPRDMEGKMDKPPRKQ